MQENFIDTVFMDPKTKLLSNINALVCDKAEIEARLKNISFTYRTEPLSRNSMTYCICKW